MKAWLKVTISALVITSFVGGITYFMTRNFFRVKRIEITLAENNDPSFLFPKVQASLEQKLHNVYGQFVWQVDIQRILALIEQDRRIRDVFVTRVLPNTIRVVIEPQVAFANIMGNDSLLFYPLSQEGDVMPAVRAPDAPDGPILRGAKFLQSLDYRTEALKLLHSLPETGAFSRAAISEIHMSEKNGLRMILKKSGSEVLIGKDDYKNRTSYVSRVIHYLDSERLSGRVIDARYSKKVVVKLRNEP